MAFRYRGHTLTTTFVKQSATAPAPALPYVDRFPGVIGTFMGRDALSLARSFLRLNANDTVLLPVYTCQEVIRSFVGRTRVAFYDILPDLTIDPEGVRSKLHNRQVKMMLITNYFGFLQPCLEEIRKICVNNGTRLIEDCAHSLLTEGSGETGDLVVHSFRKILPLPDGGGLKVNCDGDMPKLKFRSGVYSSAISLFISAKSALNIHTEMLSRARLTSYTTKVLPSAAAPEKDERLLPLSYFARTRINKMSFPDVIKKRRNDFRFWQEVCKPIASIVPVFEDLPAGVCPFGYAVKVRNRAALELAAWRAGIPLKVHWRLDPSLGPECTTSHQLTTELLTLPLYPEIGPKGRGVLAKLLARS